MVSVGCHEGCVGWLQELVVCCCDFTVHSIMGELWLRCISSRLLKFKVYFLTWLGAVLTGRIHQWHFLQEPLRKWACWHGTLALDPLGHIDVCSVLRYLRRKVSFWGMFRCTCTCSLQMGDVVVNGEATIIQMQRILQPSSCVCTALTCDKITISFTRHSVRYRFLIWPFVLSFIALYSVYGSKPAGNSKKISK